MANAQIGNLAVSAVNASFALSPVVYLVTLRNVGGTTCHINLNGAATTSHFPLDAGESIELGLSTTSSVQAITASGTTTLDVIGVEQW